MEFAHVGVEGNVTPLHATFSFLELLDENGASFRACHRHYRRQERRRRLQGLFRLKPGLTAELELTNRVLE